MKHLSASELEQYRRGQTGAARLLEWDDHLAACADCRARLRSLAPADDLVRWAEALPSLAERPPEKKWRWWAAAAACIAFFAVLFWGIHQRQTPALVLSLQDAGATIGLDAAGALHAPSAIPESERVVLAGVLKTGSLPPGAPSSDLAAVPGTLLGPSTADEFSPLSPLGVVVLADRPEFRWQPLAGADAYEVSVFDRDFNPAAGSGRIHETQWKPAQPLPRGALYQWQVVAYRNAHQVRTPTPPAPGAKFRILDAATASQIEAARALRPASHLLIAELCARAGFRDDAKAELDELIAANPDSALAKQLRAGL